MYLLGYDIGSSSVKAALVNGNNPNESYICQYPKTEMAIDAKKVGWAEQDPEDWWTNVKEATNELLKLSGIDSANIQSIGISYQMHGLVIVDKNHNPLRPAIIWCDSRAVKIGQKSFEELGTDHCLYNYLNSPGNFTASKLRWVKENEPEVFEKIYKIMLPGDYIAMKMTGTINTTISGLSEGIFWNFHKHDLAHKLLEHYEIPKSFIPTIVDTVGMQGLLNDRAALELGLPSSIQIGYRAGDQPNNAMSLGALRPNEVAATGGTSGVVYGIVDDYKYDPQSRVNGFAHVNHREEKVRVGQLLCINGAGIQYAWLKKQIAEAGISYEEMEDHVKQIPVGSDGLRIIPFGNGAERILNNLNTGSQINNLDFNRHTKAHLYRAALEGIAFSFVYGCHILNRIGVNTSLMKVSNDNLFKSSSFSQTISNLLNCKIEMVQTSGAIGAGIASGISIGFYANLEEAFSKNKIMKTYEPESKTDSYKKAYDIWLKDLNNLIENRKEK